VQAQFASHQRRDKGLGGPALGPEALPFAAHALARLGYTQSQSASDWRIEAKDQAMLLAMIDGLADAAMAQAPQARAGIEAWRLRRRSRAGETRLRVGHADLLAWRG